MESFGCILAKNATFMLHPGLRKWLRKGLRKGCVSGCVYYIKSQELPEEEKRLIWVSHLVWCSIRISRSPSVHTSNTNYVLMRDCARA